MQVPNSPSELFKLNELSNLERITQAVDALDPSICDSLDYIQDTLEILHTQHLQMAREAESDDEMRSYAREAHHLLKAIEHIKLVDR